MKHKAILLLICLFAACSDPIEKLRKKELEHFPEFWTERDQLNSIRRNHDIPATSYPFKDLRLVGSATSKDADYGLYEWSFRFGKTYEDLIEIRMVCFYDTDSIVMHDVKTERIHWKHSKIDSRTFTFRGVEDK